MPDPREGLELDGTIRTGAHADVIDDRFRPLLSSAVDRVHAIAPAASVYVYGSVATGRARSPDSDVDLLVVGLPESDGADIARTESARFGSLCRAVEVAVATPADFEGDADQAYGGRVFLHHYCVHLAGPDVDLATAPFPGDRRAARGFNGDIGEHLDRWRHELDDADPGELGRRLARKTLFATAGLVSVHDRTWTTDRRRAARRWGELHPHLRAGLDRLAAWAHRTTEADRAELRTRLDETVTPIVNQFDDHIGLWRST